MLWLWLNLSPSLPLGLYHTVPSPPVRGAIVVVCLPAQVGSFARARGYLGRGPCPGEVERLGKRVAAVAGDTVETDAEGVRINHYLVPYSRPLSSDPRGRVLTWAPRRFVVKPGELFLLATEHPRSFDGRYFGAIPERGAIVVQPLLVLRAHADGVRSLEQTAEPDDSQPHLGAADHQPDNDAKGGRRDVPAERSDGDRRAEGRDERHDERDQ
jgi:conjugative transfer signal peptidase TraF